MTRYVIDADVAIRLVRDGIVVHVEHELLAPTLLRSQVLSSLHDSVQRGEVTRQDADRQLADVRKLRMRLLGDRVLQDVAWRVADQLGWSATFDAEYVALTQLQADAFVTLDEHLASAVEALVTVAPFEALTRPCGGPTGRG